MEHDRAVEALSEYRDGALSAADRAAVARHADGCADCSATLSDWARLSKAFLRRPPAPTPFQTEAFVARVTARLPDAAPVSLRWLTERWLVPALGLSFAVLALSFRSYGAREASDPAVALLSGSAPRSGVLVADAFGLGAEDR